MMTPTPIRLLPVAGLLLAAAWAPAAHGQESLLWKAISLTPATVVPQYANQVSPFPQTFIPKAKEKVDEEALLAEQAERQRMRDEAFNNVEGLIKSGKGFEPMLKGLRVGGTLKGLLGARVLLNNQWVGVGSDIPVRRTSTSEMKNALAALDRLDAEAAAALEEQVSQLIKDDATYKLTIKQIAERAITLASPAGHTYSIPIPVQ